MGHRTFAGLVALILAQAVYAQNLQTHRNLGKAFFENPTTQKESISEFKKAFDLAPGSVPDKLNYALALLHGDRVPEAVALLEEVQKQQPSLPHSWFNLGIYYKNAGEPEKALAQFTEMERLTPNEPIVHYQLCSLLRAAGRNDEAIGECAKASALNPLLAAAHFQLYNLYRQASRTADAAKELAVFQQLKKQTEGDAIPEDVDWCNYAEIYDPPRPVTAAPAPGKPVFTDRMLGPARGMLDLDAGLLVWSATGVRLYRNGGVLVPGTGLEGITGVVSIAAGDFDNDGQIDLCVLTESGARLYRNTRGHFAPFNAKLPERRFERAVWIDYDHDYDLDLLLLGDKPALLRNQGKAGFEDRTQDFPFSAGHVKDAVKLRVDPDSKAFDLAVFYTDHAPVLYADQLGGHYTAGTYSGEPPSASLEGDFDHDGSLDRARIADDGKLHVMLNRTVPAERWIRVRVTGVRNLKLAEDAVVEVKSGANYWRQTYAGAPLLFPVGSDKTVDVVRITWPNGLIQNEVNQPTNQTYNYVEQQRLSGSCPMIWTSNGKGFEFITDVLGVAPLGASDGEGTFFPVDHQEYVKIPQGALAPANGHYEVRITEELSEVSYLDQVKLIALDHPANKEIFTNDKFKAPPFPEFRLFEVSRRIYPAAAHDGEGRDIRPALLAKDQRYPDAFPRTELGVAQLHTIELDFGDAASSPDAVLLANGWVDWPDGSTFRAAAQEQKSGLVTPYLQMLDGSGKWVTVNEDMGMPAGKPRTIAVPLHFISSARKLRIVTNLCVYWDEIFLSESAGPAEARQTPLTLDTADLHFRGFSESHVDPARKQPDTYIYDRLEPMSFWNPTPGLYTRYGDVRELANDVDDRLVIMGSGDELTLHFDAAANLPPLPAGWTRDFLLKVDGWAKDRDPNTAFSQTVEPLPFHAMSRYPYPMNESFPNDFEHARYRALYNTRPALRLLRPLSAAR